MLTCTDGSVCSQGKFTIGTLCDDGNVFVPSLLSILSFGFKLWITRDESYWTKGDFSLGISYQAYQALYQSVKYYLRWDCELIG